MQPRLGHSLKKKPRRTQVLSEKRLGTLTLFSLTRAFMGFGPNGHPLSGFSRASKLKRVVFPPTHGIEPFQQFHFLVPSLRTKPQESKICQVFPQRNLRAILTVAGLGSFPHFLRTSSDCPRTPEFRFLSRAKLEPVAVSAWYPFGFHSGPF